MNHGRAEPDLDAWLRRHREELVRRWIAVVVERATLDELAARPLSEWIRALDTRLEPGGHADPAAARPRPSPAAENGDEEVETFAAARDREEQVEAEIERQLVAHRAGGRPFAIALLGAAADLAPGGPERPGAAAWAAALREVRGDDGPSVLPAGHGATAILMPRLGPIGARAAVDRLRVHAWELLGERGPLADAGLAVHPDDGATAADLLAAARNRLRRAWESPLGPAVG